MTLVVSVLAQDTTRESKRDFTLINKLMLEVRADLTFNQPVTTYAFEENQLGESSYGFQGRYFNFHMGGNLAPNLSYYFRQGIVANPGSHTFFDNTDL